MWRARVIPGGFAAGPHGRIQDNEEGLRGENEAEVKERGRYGSYMEYESLSTKFGARIGYSIGHKLLGKRGLNRTPEKRRGREDREVEHR